MRADTSENEGRIIGLYGPNQGAGFIASIVGAIIVLYIYRSLRKRQASGRA